MVSEAGWWPIHDGHSIAEMSLSLQLARFLDEKAIGQLRNAKAQLENLNLPGLQELRGLQFNVTGGHGDGIPFQQAESAVVGLRFLRSLPTGVIAEQASAQNNLISYTTAEYTRWEKVAKRAFDCLSAMLTALDSDVPAYLVLTYTDKFVSSVSSPGAGHPLFRSDAHDVTPRLLHASGPWHCNSGFFDVVGNGKALVNVNCQVVSESSGRTATVMTYIRYEPDGGFGVGDLAEVLATSANSIHAYSKMLVGGVLSREMKLRIGLKEND